MRKSGFISDGVERSQMEVTELLMVYILEAVHARHRVTIDHVQEVVFMEIPIVLLSLTQEDLERKPLAISFERSEHYVQNFDEQVPKAGVFKHFNEFLETSHRFQQNHYS